MASFFENRKLVNYPIILVVNNADCISHTIVFFPLETLVTCHYWRQAINMYDDILFIITKTRLFKYIENFTTKKMKIFR